MKLSEQLEQFIATNKEQGYGTVPAWLAELWLSEVKDLESRTVGGMIAEGLEEVADTVASTQEEYQGYVIRIQNYRGVLGYVYDTSDGYGYRDYQDRHVFDTMTEAEQVRARKKLLGGAYARVIPNGSREYCRDVEAFVLPAYMG